MALTDNLVAYYKLDESSGNITDSVNSNNGTNVDSTTFGAGKINNGSIHNGTSQYFTLPNLGTGISGANARTISFWIKSDDVSTTSLRTIFHQGVQTEIQLCSLVTGVATGSLYWSFSGNDYFTGNVISAGTWYHVVAVYDGGTLSTSTVHIYLNGSAQSLTKTGTNTLTANTANSGYSIGYYDSTNPRYYDGMIDEMGWWSRALSSTEVTSLYNSGNGLAYPFTTSSTSIKTINGLAQASVKTVNGLAIASVKSINGLSNIS